jgi:aspartyl/asparaginyl-tRNA synthetase
MNLITPPSSHLNPEQHVKTLLTHPWYEVVNKLFSEILRLTHDFYCSEDISPTIFPITTGSVSSPMGLGSDSLPVKATIKHTGLDVYLADSMQFSLELGARLNKRGAYYVMPTFRGEDIDKRHLNEFVHSEAEIKGNLEDVIKLVERYIKFMTKGLLESSEKEISSVVGSTSHLQNVLDKSFPRITFNEAIKELQTHKGAYEKLVTGDLSITPKGEKLLMKNHGEFLWLTHLPWGAVPFYQSKLSEDPNQSNTADLLAGIGEILGSGQRVFDGKDLDESLEAHQVELHGYQWYREMHEEYPLQTSGFGLGIERYILWLLQHDDIRDCTLLLRDHKEVIFP